MQINVYQKRSLVMLLPLGLLAVSSYALDKRIPLGISFDMQHILLQFFSLVMPGLFAIAVSSLMPTSNRFSQLLAVGFNYSFLTCISKLFYQYTFTQPTAIVIASLTATLFLLPSNDLDSDNDNITFFSFLSKAIGILLTPLISLICFVVIIKNVEHSILITFTTVFIESTLSCIFVPIYEFMLTFGFSSVLNSVVSVQTNSETVNAILNSITLTNLVSLPVIILTKALFSDSYSRIFLVFLALITCLSAKIGSCISIELAILMFFFPGTLIALCLSSVVVFFFCYNMQLQTFTSFYMLYEPDLVLKNLTLLHINTYHHYAIALSVVCPILIQIAFSKIGLLNLLKDKFKSSDKIAGYKPSQLTNPDLQLIAILKALGGISNICNTSLIGNELYVKVFKYKRISTFRLNLFGKNKITYLRAFSEVKFSFGLNSQIIYQRLQNILSDSKNYNQSYISLTRPFDINEYLNNLQENLNREQQHRLDPN